MNSANYAEDLDSQSPNNYTYDGNGNLIGDVTEGLTMYWNNYGKLDSLKNTNKSIAMKFRYDPMGNRIEKRLYHLDGSGSVIRQSATHYVRDAQGNPLAVYNLLGGDTLVVNEFNLYGSNRLGMLTTADTLVCATCTTATAPSVYLSPVGNKRYELSNHLGNVMTVISDKPVPIDTTSDGLWDYFNASMVSATDYYPFGMGMPGRIFVTDYPIGINGQEKVENLKGVGMHYTATYWEYDPRLGRRWNLDPLVKPWINLYHAFSNKPTNNIDPNGAEDSPIYDSKTGLFLGVDDKGFWEGEILFMNNERYRELSKNGLERIKSDFAAKNSDFTIESLPNNTKGLALFEAAYNSIARTGYQLFEGQKPSLLNNSVRAISSDQMLLLTGDSETLANYITATPSPDIMSGWKEHQIVVNFGQRQILNTAGNVFSNFLHEYKYHGELNLNTSDHKQIYRLQIDHPSFKYTSGKYRNSVLNQSK